MQDGERKIPIHSVSKGQRSMSQLIFVHTVGSALGLKSKGCWFEPTVGHYFSSNNVRLLAYTSSRPVRSGWHLSSTSHIDTSTTFCPLITQTLRIISVRCIPLSLRSKTRRRATLLLPTWICSCQLVGTVIFILPFTTNVTISISILQTFRS